MGAEDIRRQAPNVLRMHALGRGGPAGHERHGDAQGRGQRGDARLGHERRDDPLRPRLGDGPAPVPDDRARPPAGDRRRGGGPARRPSRAGCPTSSLACVGGGSNAIGLLDGSSASRRSGWPSPRRPGRGSRPAVTRRRSPAGRRGSSTARARSCSRTATARSSRRTRSRPGSTTRASGRRSPRSSTAGRLEVAAATDAEAVAAIREVARTEGILPALETAHAFAVLPRLLAGHRGLGPAVPCRRRVVLVGLSGRGDKDLAALERGEAPGDERGRRRTRAAAGVRGHERHRGRPADRRRLRPRALRDGRAALIPYIVAGYPDAETSLARRPRGHRRRGRPPRGRSAVLGPARRRRDAPAGRRRRAARPARRSTARSRCSRGSPRPGPALPLVPMCYANQVIGGGDGTATARRLADAGASGVIVADLTPDEGDAVRGGRPGCRARRRLPRRPDDRSRSAGHGSPPGPAGSSTASRSSASPGRATGCPGRSAGSSATSAPPARSRWRSGSGSAGRPTSGRSSMPAPTASSSRRRSSMRSARTAATSPRSGAWSRSSGRPRAALTDAGRRQRTGVPASRTQCRPGAAPTTGILWPCPASTPPRRSARSGRSAGPLSGPVGRAAARPLTSPWKLSSPTARATRSSPARPGSSSPASRSPWISTSSSRSRVGAGPTSAYRRPSPPPTAARSTRRRPPGWRRSSRPPGRSSTGWRAARRPSCARGRGAAAGTPPRSSVT